MHSHHVALGHITLHLLEWSGRAPAFVLLHGLSSNAHTWRGVAECLAAAGHHVVALDQRGHGRSDKPPDGYDFESFTSDLAHLLDTLSLEAPIVAGQSWGGNVVLSFAAQNPGRVRGLALVDGGFVDLQHDGSRPWESVERELRPPDLDGTSRSQLAATLREHHPEWEAWGIEATLHNFEHRSDGTLRRWLPIPHHMRILRALWEQRPKTIYPRVREPVLIAVAGDEDTLNPARVAQVAAARAGLMQAEVVHFPNTDHDIHVHRPARLARLLLDRLNAGFWG